MSYFDIGYVRSFAEKMYPSESFAWISGLARNIKNIGSKVGVSPGAIAGIMAEERKDYANSETLTKIADWIAQYEVEPSQLEVLIGLMAGPGAAALEYLLKLTNPPERTHEYWKNELAVLKADQTYSDINFKPSISDQLRHPIFIDVGYGNFRIRKAIDIIENNSTLSAQLGLDIYKNDYALLVKDMINPNSDVTAKLYAIYLKEAEDWYKANSAYGNDWDSLPVEFKDSLLVTFVNLGQTKMESLRDTNKSKNDALGYQPVPAYGTGGGINHLVNSASIGNVLGLAGYGSKILEMSDIESVAKNNTSEGLAARYALLNLRPVILPNIDYSIVNQQHELDLYDETTKQGELTSSWIHDRAIFLNTKGIYELSGRTDNIVNGNGISNSVINLNDANSNMHISVKPPLIFPGTATINLSFGGKQNEELKGDYNEDHVYGGGGNDTLKGEAGFDYLEGNAGNDLIYGGDDADELLGGEGDDQLVGEGGNDILEGGTGNDTYSFTGQFGRDMIKDSDGIGSIEFSSVK